MQRLLLLPQRLQKVHQPIDLDFVNGGEHHAQLAGRETFLGKPLKIRNRQIAENYAFIFSKWHFH